jgi:hypothetical protein
MNFVNYKNPISAADGPILAGFYDFAHVVYACIAGCVCFYYVRLVIIGESQARCAATAWLWIASIVFFAAESLGQNSGDRRFSNSVSSGKK